MSPPLGNSNSMGALEGHGGDSPVENDPTFTPSTVGSELVHTDDDEGSEPSEVVVSPHNSPDVSLVENSGNEEFQDAQEPCTTTSLPPSSILRLALQSKDTPFALKSWNSMVLTLDGRDKITKLFQYLCRLLSWWFAGRGRNQLSLKFLGLSTSLSNSRKAFRLGRSLIELEKLRNVGLSSIFMWHLRKYLGCVGEVRTKEEMKPPTTPSSHTGDGSSPPDETQVGKGSQTEQPSSSFVKSASLVAYRAVSLPLRCTLSSLMGPPSTRRISTAAELWMAIGSAVKLMGLCGFWTGDNINYICSTGFLDDLSLPEGERLAKRTHLQTLSSVRANQAYFGGSIAGLFVSAYTYINYRRTKLAVAEQSLKEASLVEGGEDQIVEAEKQLTGMKKEQFSLFLALLKSVCDVIVCSNNPGVDLHQRYRGKKNHEGLHCVCGLVSAGTVLFNNFPDRI
jgi:Peroxisomal biogenesis factor 11 (PEX11)